MAETGLEFGERIAALEKDNENIHHELKDLKKQNEAIYEIATSVKLISQELQGVKTTVDEVKTGQDSLSGKLDAEMERVRTEQNELHNRINEVDLKGAKRASKFLREFGSKAAWLTGGALIAWLLYQAFPFLQ